MARYTRPDTQMSLTGNRCADRVMTGAALGATVGGAVGAVYGTYESFAYKVEARRRYFPHAAVDADSHAPIITHPTPSEP